MLLSVKFLSIKLGANKYKKRIINVNKNTDK